MIRQYIQKIILDKKLELQKQKLEIKSDQKEYSAATLLEANANLLVAKTVAVPVVPLALIPLTAIFLTSFLL